VIAQSVPPSSLINFFVLHKFRSIIVILMYKMSASNITETPAPPETSTLINEETLAEQSKRLPPHLLLKKHPHHSLSNSSSFEDPPSSELVLDNEYGQLPPGRIHSLHKKGTHHRLHGSSGGGAGSVLLMDGMVTTSGGTSTPRSRSRSPSMGRSGGAVAATIITNATIPNMSLATDGNSSLSSMDDYESDLLTDRAGVLDDLSDSQRKLHSSKEFHVPATVLERMSEDSLEDNHAFSDLVRICSSSRDGNFSSNASRVSHVSGSNAGDGMLEPLDECDEGLENDSLEDSVTDQNYYISPQDDTGITDATGNPIGGTSGHDSSSLQPPTTTVILTNMENLTLESANNEYLQYQGYSSQAGSVSLFESVGGVAGSASHTAACDATAGGSVNLPPESTTNTTNERTDTSYL
jgi:hypothetical protein